MASGFSIHIGVNNLDPDHYGGSGLGTLKSCVKDANDMAHIAQFHHFSNPIILEDATAPRVIAEIRKFTKCGSSPLHSGDILLITYSGHGDQIKDDGLDEIDGSDERWCLYDRELLDDELVDLWTDFNGGVRILVISDSCHSGTITDLFKLRISNELRFLLKEKGFDFCNFAEKIFSVKGFDFAKYNEKIWDKNKQILEEENIKERLLFDVSKLDELELITPRAKFIPKELSKEIYKRNKPLYDEIRVNVRDSLRTKLKASNERNYRDLVKASVLLISACQDWDITEDGIDEKDNGVFTKALKLVWNNGKFTGNYLQFRDLIWCEIEKIRPEQKPNYYPSGYYNAAFELQTPFTI